MRTTTAFTVLSALFLSASLSASPAGAAEYSVDASHSRVGFQVRHLLSKVSGEFKEFEGSFQFDPAKLDAATVKFTANAASINTNNGKRDEHLRSAEFLDTAKFKTLSFESKKLSPAGQDKKYKLEGNLTIHGVTKPATFEVEFLGADKDPWGGTRAGFTATTTINRKDFGVVWNKVLESGRVLVGEEVTINLEVEALQKK
jgi:polyisoprenoid-binding protein YceI